VIFRFAWLDVKEAKEERRGVGQKRRGEERKGKERRRERRRWFKMAGWKEG